MSNVLRMPARTYTAKMFTVPWESKDFKIAGTLDGFIDLAIPGGGTYQLNQPVARLLAESLKAALADIQENCLYDNDGLLQEDRP